MASFNNFKEPKAEGRAASTHQNFVEASKGERQGSWESSRGWTWTSRGCIAGKVWHYEGWRSWSSRYTEIIFFRLKE